MSRNSLILILDRANNSIQFPLYFIVLSILKMVISLEPYANVFMGFQHDKALTLRHTIEMKTEFTDAYPNVQNVKSHKSILIRL